jgi:hypothetical protein
LNYEYVRSHDCERFSRQKEGKLDGGRQGKDVPRSLAPDWLKNWHFRRGLAERLELVDPCRAGCRHLHQLL